MKHSVYFVGKTRRDNDEAYDILDRLHIGVYEYEATDFDFTKFDCLYFGKISWFKLQLIRLILWVWVCNGRFAVCE